MERALNYIFQGPDALVGAPEIHSIADSPPSVYEEKISLDQLEDKSNRPELPPRYSDSNHIEHVEHREYSEHIVHEVSSDEDEEVEQYTSVYDNVYRYHLEEDEIPILMPVKSGYLESYLNPMLMIFYQIPQLRKDVFGYEFESLGFNSRWFKGEKISVPEENYKFKLNNEDINLSFLLEVQRLFAFLTGESERAFTSVNNFIKSFPTDSKKKFQEIDNLHEAYEIFVDSLILQLNKVGINSSKMFHNFAMDSGTQESRSFSVFNIDCDDMNKDLYYTIHSVLWNNNFESDQYITSLADIVTLTFESSYQHNYSSENLLVTEEFYPQIYTVEFKDVIKDCVTKRNELEKERRELSMEVMKLNSFNGKSITNCLNSSINYLNDLKDDTISDSIKDLSNIQESITSKKIELNDKIHEIGDQKRELSPYNIKNLLSKAPNEIEPYLLTGIIFSPSKCAILIKKKTLIDEIELNWCLIRYKPDDFDDFEIKVVEFEYLQKLIYSSTGTNFQSSIVLTFVKKSVFMKDLEVNLNDSIKTFINKDKEELMKTLELIISSSDESMDDKEEDGDDEEEEADRELIELNEK